MAMNDKYRDDLRRFFFGARRNAMTIGARRGLYQML
jgi:hypothetical protein